ncbi:flavodoxin [Marinilabiliaceae bacterium ANBcel2]|nr:flavodoxin [Marinilabiliaceae bacterium ANBcel2]
MKKIGIFYSFKSKKTHQQVKYIIKNLGEKLCEEVDIEDATLDDFNKFNNYIFAAPTWFDGELPNYLDEFLPMIEDQSMKDKKVAIFGGGDQKNYPENFVDGIGILAEFFEERGAKVVGFTSVKGYKFEYSRAQRGDKFTGLALDIENQAALTHERIEKWIDKIKKEFEKN